MCGRLLFFSPSQGLCCSLECQFKPDTHLCDEETDCQEASFCSGLTALCPPPTAKEKFTVCSQGTRICLDGVRRSKALQQNPGLSFRATVTDEVTVDLVFDFISFLRLDITSKNKIMVLEKENINSHVNLVIFYAFLHLSIIIYRSTKYLKQSRITLGHRLH